MAIRTSLQTFEENIVDSQEILGDGGLIAKRLENY
ncbi:MAG: hypothetical protein ACI87E_004932, partial [Mariniblastus sp.]